MYDRLLPPPKPSDEDAWSDVARFYLIGLGSRGQMALKQFGILDQVVDYCVTVVGRKDWAPDSEEGNEQIFTDRKVQTIVLPRDKLVGILDQHILQNYDGRIQLNYGYEIQPVDFGTDPGKDRVLVRASQCSPVVYNVSASEEKTASEQQAEVLCDTQNSILVSSKLLVAADGTVRTVANAISTMSARCTCLSILFQCLEAERTMEILMNYIFGKRWNLTLKWKSYQFFYLNSKKSSF